MSADIAELKGQVQRNCHISDALHAREYSLCIYLLKMREYYRWEMGFGYTDRLPNEALGQWLVEREQLWQTLEAAEFAPIDVAGEALDPFDSAAINERLLTHGLVYSGGYGRAFTPHFFLAELEREEAFDEHAVLITGREFARDITAPPAMLQDGTIFVRKESLRRMLWERLEEWQWRKQENPMGRAARAYDFDGDFNAALDRMTDNETETVILHEVGELQASRALGPEWEKMLGNTGGGRNEYFARAVRDHLADCTVTLPHLLDRGAVSSLHFYFANLSGLRKAIFPELLKSYRHWCESGRLDGLERTVMQGRERWAQTGEALLACHREGGDSACYGKLIAGFGI